MNEFIDLKYLKKRRNREELLKHLNDFSLDIKLTVGIWYFTPSGGRFHDHYIKQGNIKENIEMAAGMEKYVVRGIEAHYPTEVNEENLYLYRQLEKETGIKLFQFGPLIFFDREYEFGSLSSPIKSSRDRAIKLLINTLKFAKEAGGHHVGIWPGIDGYLYSLGTVFYEMWDRFEDAVAIALDEVPGMRIAIEPKPYEPMPNNIYRSTIDGLLACRDIELRLKSKENLNIIKNGGTIMGMQPEIGHIRMGFEDVPYAFSRITRQARLVHTHWNSQPLGNYDQDLDTGVVEWQQAEAGLYVLKMIGYKEYFGIDINPERIPVKKAVEINWKALTIMNERINNLPHEDILECYYDPVNKRGKLEEIVISQMKP